MTPEQHKEQFSLAYVRAVAAASGVNVYRPELDSDSVDIGFAVRSLRDRPFSPRLEAQVKATSQPDLTDQHIRFPLKAKNYNDLCGNHFVPRILVLVILPEAVGDWLLQSEEHLLLRWCGFWVSLADLAPSDNISSVTVAVPRVQAFSVTDLKHLLGQGATP